MKKALSLLLVLCMCISFCSCGSRDDTPQETEPTKTKAITISYTNVSKYLNVKVSPYVQDSHRRAKVEIYPIQAGDFSNTTIYLKLKTDNVCSIYEIVGEKYEESKKSTERGCYIVEIKLPVTGTYEFDVGFSCIFDTSEPIEKWEFDNARGTFSPRA